MRFILLALVSASLVALVSSAAIAVEQPTRTLAVRSDTPLHLPFNVANPGATPAFIHPLPPVLLPIDQVVPLLSTTTTLATSLLAQTAAKLSGVTQGLVSGVTGLLCGLLPCPAPAPPSPSPVGQKCLNSSYDERAINSLFQYGGAGTTVFLCPRAVISINSGPIQFSAANQTLTTYLEPGVAALLPDMRATVKLVGSSTSCAIYTADVGRDRATVSNIQVDGNRPTLGYFNGGLALMEMGGTNADQVVDNVRIFEPRAWSALHIIEGSGNSCVGAVVKDCQIGPAGQAPTGPTQYRLRERETGPYPPYQWADGISLSCRNSVVTNNVITDATDGGVVIFGSPGSTISGNTIVARSRQLLGGMNAVDYNPWSGNFEGLKVSGNTIRAESVMIKIGIAVGQLSWTDQNTTRTHGGSFEGNTFTSGVSGYFGYGITVSGHNDATVVRNRFTNANFGGLPTNRCYQPLTPVGPLYRNQYTTPSANLQPEFVDAGAIQFMICNGPGPIVTSGVNI